ncbi:MAG: hypothetical protein B0D92_02050 [Spirochaeta sp. LUC14_002_19_P3]|nr:MAG: hypothetical protein B0D92_02050 [Spirochaeta sp. LUC14_002_19_P3]
MHKRKARHSQALPSYRKILFHFLRFTLHFSTALLLFIGGCQRSPREASPIMNLNTQALPVKTFIAKEEEIQTQLESYGNISYVRKADITVSVEGTYENLLYEEGDRVRAGTLVARLSNVQLNIQLAQAKAAITSSEAGLELAEAALDEGRRQVEARLLGLAKSALEIEQKQRELEELERTKSDQQALFEVGGVTESALRSAELTYMSAATDLALLEKDLEIRRIGFRDQDILSHNFPLPAKSNEKERTALLIDINTRTLQAELDAAQSRLTSAKTQLESAQALIDELSLESPISGIIGTRNPEVGEKASPGDSVYTVFESGEVHAVFPVQEADAIALGRGMTVNISIDAYPNEEFSAAIDRISPIVSPQSGNVTVRALLPNRRGRLQPGMFARVRVNTGAPHQGITIPLSALIEKREEEGTLYTVRGGRAFIKTVSLGRQTDGRIEITDNLDAGEIVIDEPSPLLREGEELSLEE